MLPPSFLKIRIINHFCDFKRYFFIKLFTIKETILSLDQIIHFSTESYLKRHLKFFLFFSHPTHVTNVVLIARQISHYTSSINNSLSLFFHLIIILFDLVQQICFSHVNYYVRMVVMLYVNVHFSIHSCIMYYI